jgi:hypothetical protein
MAGYGADRPGSMARRIAEANEAWRWLLAVSFKQCSLDRLGLARSSLRADSFANLPCSDKHSRRAKKRGDGNQQPRCVDTAQAEVFSLHREGENSDDWTRRCLKHVGRVATDLMAHYLRQPADIF